MPYRLVPLENDNYYHVFNRGVERREIFLNAFDCKRFVRTIIYYQINDSKRKFSSTTVADLLNMNRANKLVEIIGYCLMPNHYHLLLKQTATNGISNLLRKGSNSYTKYFNTKYDRVGPLFQGAFKARLINSNEDLLHVLRYIHLNPFIEKNDMGTNLSYTYSSFDEYVNKAKICSTGVVKDLLGNQDYSLFHTDQIKYAREVKSAMQFDE